jgi:hypothetical protein
MVMDLKSVLKKHFVLFVGIAVLAIALFFYPRPTGGTLCGPICPILGIQTWEQDCIGFIFRPMIVDGNEDFCLGLTHGERRCYGTPFPQAGSVLSSEMLVRQKLDCDYPCGDAMLAEECKNGGNVTFYELGNVNQKLPIFYDCDRIFAACGK